MRLTSPAFDDGAAIPVRHTCRGDDVSPPLALSDLPPQTRSLVLIMEDPDAPLFLTWTHWVAFNIPPAAQIPEDSRDLGVQGRTSWRRPGYRGPCPPWGTHAYVFTACALDTMLDLPPGASKKAVRRAMEGHVLATAQLTGIALRRSGA